MRGKRGGRLDPGWPDLPGICPAPGFPGPKGMTFETQVNRPTGQSNKRPQLDFNQPWTTDMLAGRAGEFIDRFALDKDKGYLGDPVKSIVEIGFCPFCRTPMVLVNGCPHVVFCFDLREGKYRYVRKDFKDLTTNGTPAPMGQSSPEELERRVDGLKLSIPRQSAPFLGFIWGYITKS